MRKNSILKYYKYVKNFLKFKKAHYQYGRKERITWQERYVCLDDQTSTTNFDRHYTYHPAWAARILAEVRPLYHVDISSIIGFNAITSAFIPIHFYDFRPPNLYLDGLKCHQGNILSLPLSDNSVPSVSCMHVIEHIGLGRYGDDLDPNGDIKALKELTRVLMPGGSLLIAVPVGKERIQFNAHRIYNHQNFLSYFSDVKLKNFTLIPDGFGGMIEDPPNELVDKQSNGCGCYWFIKE